MPTTTFNPNRELIRECCGQPESQCKCFETEMKTKNVEQPDGYHESPYRECSLPKPIEWAKDGVY